MLRINKIERAARLNRDELFRYGRVDCLMIRPSEFKLADGRAAMVSSTKRGMSLP